MFWTDQKHQFEKPNLKDSHSVESQHLPYQKTVWISTSMSLQALKIVNTCELKEKKKKKKRAFQPWEMATAGERSNLQNSSQALKVITAGS